MSVTFDVATASGNFAGGSSKTFNHAGGGTVDLATVAVAWVKYPSGTNTVSVTYGGVSMTQCRAAGVKATGAGNGYVHSFYLATPGTGTKSVVITFSNSSNYGQGGALTWTGNDTTTPIAGTAEASGTSTNPTVNVGSTSGNFCFDALMISAVSPTATLTQNWNVNDSGIRGASQRTASTGSAVAMSWTSSSSDWLIQAYEIAAAGGGGISGVLASTEGGDSVSATGAVLIQGTLVASEAGDTLSAVGGVLIQGASSPTEADDTLAGTGTVLVQGALSSTEADDTLAATGVLGSTITGDLAVTEADDTLSAAGTVLVQGTLSATEANDTVSATGTVLVQGSLSATEANDTVSATGSVLVQGALSATEADDTLVATGLVGALPTINGVLAITEQDDTLLATGTVPSVDSGGGGPDRSDDAPAERYTNDASGWRKPAWVRERELKTAVAEPVSPVLAQKSPAIAPDSSVPAQVSSVSTARRVEPKAAEPVAIESIAPSAELVDIERARIATKLRQAREMEEIMTVLMMAA